MSVLSPLPVTEIEDAPVGASISVVVQVLCRASSHNSCKQSPFSSWMSLVYRNYKTGGHNKCFWYLRLSLLLVGRVAIVAKKGRYHCLLGMGCKLRVLPDVVVVVYPTQATQPTARLTRRGLDLKRNIPTINFYSFWNLSTNTGHKGFIFGFGISN